ncbi:hypothetical protein [Streptomyces sp. Ag109_O5-10]|uniref:hypothetical protein n=1 Tax=Streptomyces sp. Ag109_O5-10 TaxID=1855349 RepID=UPI00089A73B2|nr:hypothetical protein [Streptomyces sp. Ag109_O5-10]SEF01391.1 lactate permease [Streptomyces sp. Ag109_O5-10]
MSAAHASGHSPELPAAANSSRGVLGRMLPVLGRMLPCAGTGAGTGADCGRLGPTMTD